MARPTRPHLFVRVRLSSIMVDHERIYSNAMTDEKLTEAIMKLESAEYGLSGITWQDQAKLSLTHLQEGLDILREINRNDD